MRIRNSKGYTLVEMVLTAAVSGAVILGLVRFSATAGNYLNRSYVRHQVNIQGRVGLASIQNLLAKAKASTLSISTASGSPIVPNSQAQFSDEQGNQYTISWSNDPKNTVNLQTVRASDSVTTNTTLAKDVSLLIFNVDYRDPAIIQLSMEVSVPLRTMLTSTSTPYKFFVSNQLIRMIDS
jgi:hypothetical protein